MFTPDCWFPHGYNLAELKGNTGAPIFIGQAGAVPATVIHSYFVCFSRQSRLMLLITSATANAFYKAKREGFSTVESQETCQSSTKLF